MENRAINMQENWLRCNVPESQDDLGFTVTSIVQDLDGTKILLGDGKIGVEVFWEGLTPILRSTDEGIRMRTWGEVQTKYNDKKFFRGCFLYRVENSKLLDLAEEESSGFYDKSKLLHYCIVTPVDLVDVVATFEPSVKIIANTRPAVSD